MTVKIFKKPSRVFVIKLEIAPIKLLKRLLNLDHSNFDSFVVCIMSHGDLDNAIVGADCQLVKLQDLVDRVKDCQTLAGKPKMFIVQACRGGSESSSLSYSNEQADSVPKRPPNMPESEHTSIPHDANVIILNSTCPGKVACRHPANGSPFINMFCDVLRENTQTMHLTQMITKVNKHLCDRKSKQCCDTQDHLRKEIRFSATVTI